MDGLWGLLYLGHLQGINTHIGQGRCVGERVNGTVSGEITAKIRLGGPVYYSTRVEGCNVHGCVYVVFLGVITRLLFAITSQGSYS